MKRHWKIRRHFNPFPDGQRRWDRVYQNLLQWSRSSLAPLAQTIEQQLERLRAHIQSQSGILLDENIFRDDGFSGTVLNRPGLDRLRDRAAGAAFDQILLTSPDRLARKYVHQVLSIEELQSRGCPVQFLDRPMSQDPHDQLLLQIRGAVAEYERTLIIERMRRGRLSKYRAGLLLPWTRPPYGYRPQSPKIRRSATHPIGHPHTSGRQVPREQWIFVAKIPAIVCQEEFDLVQAKLAQNQSFARRHNTAHQYLLRALVSCVVCQLACQARTRPDGKYGYSLCTGKDKPVQNRRSQRCPARFTPAPQLDELVWQDVCDLLTHPEAIARAMERAQSGAWLPQELQARQENLRRGLASLEQQLQRLTEAYLNEVIPLVEYRRRRQDLEHRHQALENQARQLLAQVDRHQELAGLVAHAKDCCQRVSIRSSNSKLSGVCVAGR